MWYHGNHADNDAQARGWNLCSPGSIAGLVIAFEGHHLLQKLQELDSTASRKELAEHLEHRRYRLNQHIRGAINDCGTEGSVEGSPTVVPPKYERIAYDPGFNAMELPPTATTTRQRFPGFKWYLETVTLIALLTGLLALITYYYIHGENTPFERFMDSQTHGVRAVMVFPGVLIKTGFNRIE